MTGTIIAIIALIIAAADFWYTHRVDVHTDENERRINEILKRHYDDDKKPSEPEYAYQPAAGGSRGVGTDYSVGTALDKAFPVDRGEHPAVTMARKDYEKPSELAVFLADHEDAVADKPLGRVPMLLPDTPLSEMHSSVAALRERMDKYEDNFGEWERKPDQGMSVQRAEFNELKERVDRVYDQITDVANIAANGDMNALLQHKIRERFGDYQQPTEIGQIGKRR